MSVSLRLRSWIAGVLIDYLRFAKCPLCLIEILKRLSNLYMRWLRLLLFCQIKYNEPLLRWLLRIWLKKARSTNVFCIELTFWCQNWHFRRLLARRIFASLMTYRLGRKPIFCVLRRHGFISGFAIPFLGQLILMASLFMFRHNRSRAWASQVKSYRSGLPWRAELFACKDLWRMQFDARYLDA